MQKRVSLLGLFALALLLFLIWTDPGGTASTVGHFLGQVGGFLKELLSKITTFLGGLGHK